MDFAQKVIYIMKKGKNKKSKPQKPHSQPKREWEIMAYVLVSG